ncbi:MAG: exosome complex RNA-binding protein Csl4 [Desulfurococcaceae archaeon]
MSFVIPGESLAVEEEVLPVNGAYADQYGYVRSMLVGKAILDRYKKTLHVKPLVRRDLTLKQGSIVEGLITGLSEEVAFVKIYSAENNKVNAVGLLHVSQVSSDYVHDIYDYVRIGDIVKAKTLNSSAPYLLTIREPSTGVILAHCSSCGSVLYLHSAGYLVCRNCGRQEKRKVAVGYLYVLR